MSTLGFTAVIFDYGAGNLHSLGKALVATGVQVRVESDPVRAVDRDCSDLLVLPGVGAFDTAAERLAPARRALRDAIDEGFPIIGICLGMQLLLDRSEEGFRAGLGIVPGTVRRLRAARVPQIGWNEVEYDNEHTLNNDLRLRVAYYANSYVCEPADEDCVTSWSTYGGDRFAASVRAGPAGNVLGVQFHPEKSSAPGVAFLRALVQSALAEQRR